MQSMIKAGPLAADHICSVIAGRNSATSRYELSAYCSSVSSSLVTLKAGGGSALCLRTDQTVYPRKARQLRGLLARAEQTSGLEEKVKGVASDEAAEGPEVVDREVNYKVNKLETEDHQRAIQNISAEELLLKVKEEEEETLEEPVERDVTSSSAVEDGFHFFQDVEADGQQVAENLGRSVEDPAVVLQDKAEDLDQRQAKEAELLDKGAFEGKNLKGGLGQSLNSGREGHLIRDKAQDKVVETARDGHDALKWAAEGFILAGQTARQGFEVAKDVIGKRVKSFNIAADEVRDVSSQVADAAQKKFDEFQGSSSKFGEEFRVNLEEKKARDSLKPESETNPLAKLGLEFGENLEKATSEDGHLGRLSQTLSENLSKAGQQLGERFTSKSSEEGEELHFEGGYGGHEHTQRESMVDAETECKNFYEHGNDQLKAVGVAPSQLQERISSRSEDSAVFDIDEGQIIPSKKHNDSEIGPDE